MRTHSKDESLLTVTCERGRGRASERAREGEAWTGVRQREGGGEEREKQERA